MPLTRNTIKLGCVARDRTTGIEGVLINKTELFGGSVQYALQLPATVKPDAAPTTYPESFNLDEGQLVFVKDMLEATPPLATKIGVGHKVKDMISGFSGIVINKVTFLNGCVYLNIEADRPVSKDEDKVRFVPVQRVKFVSAGLEERAAAPEPTLKDEKPRCIGGPVTRAMRAC